MSRKPEVPDSDLLFDLPLDPAAGETADPTSAPNVAPRVAADEDGPGDGAGPQAAIDFPPADEPGEPSRPVEAPAAARLGAALLDLMVLAVVLGLSLLALRLLEIPVARPVLAPLVLFLASFSFLYQVMPLAFWGHTPGMAYRGLHSRDKRGGFMTMQQCILRWAGWVLTLASGGLGALVALSGVSLADLVSGTRTYVRPAV